MNFKATVGVFLKKVLPITVGLAVLVSVVAWTAGVMVDKIEPGPAEVASRRLDPDDHREIYEVREVMKPYVEEAVGTLKAASRTEISARVLAPIDRLYVTAGQIVSQGDTLVELDSRTFDTGQSQAQASLVSAEASLSRAENDFNRDSKLYEQRVVSRAELDQSEAAFKVATANLDHARQALDEAKVMLSYTTIKAPKDGMVVDRLAEEGDMARPGEPLLILYDPTSLRLEVPVTENLAINLALGDKLVVQIDALNNKLVQAVVDEIVPQAEAASRSLLVKVRLPRSEDLFEGMFGRLQIPVGIRRHLCLHTDAVQSIGQLEFVDVLRPDNTIERRFIKVGRFGDPQHREVLSGLAAGDRVLMEARKR